MQLQICTYRYAESQSSSHKEGDQVKRRKQKRRHRNPDGDRLKCREKIIGVPIKINKMRYEIF